MTSSDEFWKLEHLSNTQLIEGLGNVLRTKRQALAALVAHATRCKVAALCGGRRVAPRGKAGGRHAKRAAAIPVPPGRSTEECARCTDLRLYRWRRFAVE